jgi:hypothetical protein
MMKKFFRLFTIILACSLFSLQAEASSAKTQKVYKTSKLKAGEELPIYLHPTVHSSIVIRLAHVSRWIVKKKGIRKYRRSTWQKVSWNGKTGWVEAKYLKLDLKATDIATRQPNCLLKKTRTKDCEN